MATLAQPFPAGSHDSGKAALESLVGRRDGLREWSWDGCPVRAWLVNTGSSVSQLTANATAEELPVGNGQQRLIVAARWEMQSPNQDAAYIGRKRDEHFQTFKRWAREAGSILPDLPAAVLGRLPAAILSERDPVARWVLTLFSLAREGYLSLPAKWAFAAEEESGIEKLGSVLRATSEALELFAYWGGIGGFPECLDPTHGESSSPRPQADDPGLLGWLAREVANGGWWLLDQLPRLPDPSEFGNRPESVARCWGRLADAMGVFRAELNRLRPMVAEVCGGDGSSSASQLDALAEVGERLLGPLYAATGANVGSIPDLATVRRSFREVVRRALLDQPTWPTLEELEGLGDAAQVEAQRVSFRLPKAEAPVSEPKAEEVTGSIEGPPSTTSLPQGFLGGNDLAKAVGVPDSRRKAFTTALHRARAGGGFPDSAWKEDSNRRMNEPQYLFRADAPAVVAIASRYR